MGRKGGAVLYLSSRMGESYCIDLDCLPKRVSPIIQFTTETFPGWTAADTCIYCIGGFKKITAVGKTLYMFKCSNTTESTPIPTPTAVVPDRNLPLHHPYVFAFGRKIYVIGGYEPIIDCERETDLTYPGEYYHLRSKTWNYMPKLELDGVFKQFSNIYNIIVAHVMDDKTTILFYDWNTFLFYNLAEDAWKHGDRLQFFGADWLEEDHTLWDLVGNIKPVVCDSTLYWFHIDMCLYGFDYSQKRWFQSNSLQQKLQKPVPPRDCLYTPPRLLYVNNQTFVAIFTAPETGTETFELAIIKVKRNTRSGSIKGSLKSSQCIAVETSHTMMKDIVNGITIDASAEEKDVEKKGQWRLPTCFTAIGVIGAVTFVAVAYGFYKKSH